MPVYKFNRSYVIRIEARPSQDGAEWIEIKYPFTCEFEIKRSNLSATNTAQFTLYGLNSATRAKIYKDIYTNNDPNDLRAVQFFAGYAEKEGDMLPRCFNGTIKVAYSQRSGPEFRTIIECYDGYGSTGLANLSMTIPAGTLPKDQVGAVAEEMGKYTASKIPVSMGDNYKDIPKRALAIMSAPADALAQITGGTAYMDSGAIYAMQHLDCMEGDVRLLNADNGLLGTPKKSETFVEVDMLFEPRIKPNQLLELESMTDARFDGVYKVTGITHKGTISASVGNDCITTLTLTHLVGYSVIYDKNTQEYQAATV